MSVYIPLSRGQTAIVDYQDADLAATKWYTTRGQRSKTFYAARAHQTPDGKWTTQALHQVIARRMGIVGAPDHKDRNGLNNTRDNLRPATDSQNRSNRALFSNNTSGYKGVHLDKSSGKWMARTMVNGKSCYLGLFTSPVQAALVYDRASLHHFGPFAFQNFKPDLRTNSIIAKSFLAHLELAPSANDNTIAFPGDRLTAEERTSEPSR